MCIHQKKINFTSQKLRNMEGTLFYTLPQWFVFSAILAIVYGWVEDKKIFMIIGQSIFVMLGIFAIWALTTDFFTMAKMGSPAEIAANELENQTGNALPFATRIFPAYIIFVASALFALPTLYFTWKEKKAAKVLIILNILLCLTGFFNIVSALKAL